MLSFTRIITACGILCFAFHAQADDLVTKSGNVYKDYEIIKQNGKALQIRHSEGTAFVSLSEIPDELVPQLSPDIKIGGITYKNYVVEEVTHNTIRIRYNKSNHRSFKHEDLPSFLLKKYAAEITKKKKQYETWEAERIQAASKQLEMLKEYSSLKLKIKTAETLIASYPETPSAAEAKILLILWSDDMVSSAQKTFRSSPVNLETLKLFKEKLDQVPVRSRCLAAWKLLKESRMKYIISEIDRAQKHQDYKEGRKILEKLLADFPRVKYMEEAKNLLAQFRQKKHEEQRRRQTAFRTYSSGGGNRRCAECGGSGQRNVYINGRWYTVRCDGCGGSGSAGFATDYVDANGRQRSQFDQMLRRSMGGGGGVGGIFGN